MVHRRPAFLASVAIALIAGFAVLTWTMSSRPRASSAEIAPESVVDARESPKLQALVQPPASEPAPASELPTPEVRTPTAETGAQAAAITLKIDVVDEKGAAITAGELECTWGRVGFLVTDVEGHVRVPIAAASTLIQLPMSAMEGLVVARDASHAPAQVRVLQLRRKKGKWIADDQSVTHDVRIELPAYGPPSNGIWGTIYLDDVPRTPQGLTIEAKLSYDSMVAAIDKNEPSKIPKSRAPEAAVIDPDRNEYRIAGLEKGTWELRARSQETAPLGPTVTIEGASRTERRDLHFSSGAKLVLQARNALTRAIAPGLEIRLDYRAEFERTSKVIYGESVHLEGVTDSNGICAFHGLPREVMLRVRERKADESSAALLEVSIQPNDPAEVRRDLWVGGPDPSMATCWGYVAGSIAALEASEESPLTINAQDQTGGRSVKRADVTGDKWSIALAPKGSYALWLSQGSRVSVRRTITTLAGSQGPIELAPLTFLPFHLQWTNAPIGCTLEIQGGQERVERLLETREGALELQRSSDGGISVKVSGISGGFLSIGWAESALGADLTVDLHGDRQISANVLLNGAVPPGSNDLFLFAFEPPSGASYAFEMMPLASGTSTEVPLLPGPHFYSMVMKTTGGESPSAAVVTGIVDLPSGPAAAGASVKIDWHGQSLSAAEWSKLGKNGFMITRCGERELLPVKEVWRRYRFKDLTLLAGAAGASPALLFDGENCHTVAWDD